MLAPTIDGLIAAIDSGSAYDQLNLRLGPAEWREFAQSLQPLSVQVGHVLIERGATLWQLAATNNFSRPGEDVEFRFKPQGSGSSVLAAMTSQKRTLDFNQEFERFKQALLRQKRS